MACRITKRLTDLGGKLLTRKRATRINRKDGKVESVSFEDGDKISADYVVVTADPATLFGELTDLQMPKDLKKKYDNDRLFRFSAYY